MQAIKATQPKCCERRDLDARRCCIPRAAVFAGAAETAYARSAASRSTSLFGIRHVHVGATGASSALAPTSSATCDVRWSCTNRSVAARRFEELMRAKRLGACAIATVKKSDISARNVEFQPLRRYSAFLDKVIEAEKEAAANVILRREETAATRSLANTAKVMAEQPILLRLKELESLKEIASKVRELRVVTGVDNLGALLPKGLLGEPEAETDDAVEASSTTR